MHYPLAAGEFPNFIVMIVGSAAAALDLANQAAIANLLHGISESEASVSRSRDALRAVMCKDKP